MNTDTAELIERLKRSHQHSTGYSIEDYLGLVWDSIIALEAQQWANEQLRGLHESWMERGEYVAGESSSPHRAALESMDLTVARYEMDLFEALCALPTPPTDQEIE